MKHYNGVLESSLPFLQAPRIGLVPTRCRRFRTFRPPGYGVVALGVIPVVPTVLISLSTGPSIYTEFSILVLRVESTQFPRKYKVPQMVLLL